MTALTTNQPPVATPCPCGCAPCPDDCCELACAVRPNFFCGQLLRDADLTALVEWSRDKQRLSRFRDGWGVVCGLQVRPDPSTRSGVTVSAGYAVTCCGDDVVVCAPASHDFAAGREPGGRCADPDAAPIPAEPDPPGSTPGLWEGGLGPDQRKAWRAVDLLVSYAECGEEPQTALDGHSCGQSFQCENSRIRESFRLWHRDAVDDPQAATAASWRTTYAGTLETVRALQERYRDALEKPPAAGSPEAAKLGQDIRRWFVNRLKANPLGQFAALRARVEELKAADFLRQELVAELLFWIVQDRRNAVVERSCHHCEAGDGVVLARVLLRDREPATRAEPACEVAWVEPYPPWRPAAAVEPWPAEAGRLNLARVLWRRPGEACVIVAGLGIPVRSEPFTIPATVAGLATALGADPIVAYGDVAVLQVYDSPANGPRVVGVRAAPPVTMTAAPAPAAETPAPAEPARPPTSSPGGKPAGWEGYTYLGQTFAERLAANFGISEPEHLRAREESEAEAIADSIKAPVEQVRQWIRQAKEGR